ncbi:hypothetical protein USB125703_00572 [Pseudoclavibacter triregionum]|nr:hypothetical protein USB125703_00572 [Pseudoclavibacter triregionum]
MRAPTRARRGGRVSLQGSHKRASVGPLRRARPTIGQATETREASQIPTQTGHEEVSALWPVWVGIWNASRPYDALIASASFTFAPIRRIEFS